MNRAWILGTRTHRAVALMGAVVALSLAAPPPEVNTGLPVSLQTVWLVHLALATCGMLPLIPTYPTLDATFARARVDAATRAAVSTSLLGASLLLAGVREGAPVYVTIWFVLVSAAGLATAAIRPALAWVAVLVLGTVSIAWQHTDLSNPMGRILTPPLAMPALVAYLCAAVAYVVRAGDRSR